MKAKLVKHAGKILLTILLLGVGAYFGIDTKPLVDQVNAPTPAEVMAEVAVEASGGAPSAPDAGN